MRKITIPFLVLLLLITSVCATTIENLRATNTTTTTSYIKWSCNPLSYGRINVTNGDSNYDWLMRYRVGDDSYAGDNEHVYIGRDNVSGNDYRYKGVSTFNITPYWNLNISANLVLFLELDSDSSDTMQTYVYSNYSWNYSYPDCNAGTEPKNCWTNMTRDRGTLIVNWSNVSTTTIETYYNFDVTSDLQEAINIQDGLYSLLFTTQYDNESTNWGESRILWLGDITHLTDIIDPGGGHFLDIDNATYCNYSLRIYNDSARTTLFYTLNNGTYDTTHTRSITGLSAGTTYYVNLSAWNETPTLSYNATFNFTTTAATSTARNTTAVVLEEGQDSLVSLVGLWVVIGLLIVLVFMGSFAVWYYGGELKLKYYVFGILALLVGGVIAGVSIVALGKMNV